MLGAVLALLGYTGWGGQSEPVAAHRITVTVEAVRATGEAGEPALVKVALADGGPAWVLLPRAAPRPAPGEAVPLRADKYAGGTVRYRFDRASWVAGSEP